MGRVFVHGPWDLGSIPGCFIPKTFKMVLDAFLLNIQHHKVNIKGKWSNPGKGVAPSPTLRCSSYRIESLLVALDYGRQLYLYIYKQDKKTVITVFHIADLQVWWPNLEKPLQKTVGFLSTLFKHIYIYIYIYVGRLLSRATRRYPFQYLQYRGAGESATPYWIVQLPLMFT